MSIKSEKIEERYILKMHFEIFRICIKSQGYIQICNDILRNPEAPFDKEMLLLWAEKYIDDLNYDIECLSCSDDFENELFDWLYDGFFDYYELIKTFAIRMIILKSDILDHPNFELEKKDYTLPGFMRHLIIDIWDDRKTIFDNQV